LLGHQLFAYRLSDVMNPRVAVAGLIVALVLLVAFYWTSGIGA
jgi:hypothetical protein